MPEKKPQTGRWNRQSLFIDFEMVNACVEVQFANTSLVRFRPSGKGQAVPTCPRATFNGVSSSSSARDVTFDIDGERTATRADHDIRWKTR